MSRQGFQKSIVRLFGYALSALEELRSRHVDSNPLVSVIVATYNRPNSLTFALSSVIQQTYQNFEILVIGDCCTDNTEEMVMSIGDHRIKWTNLHHNSGSQSLPNNEGLRHARGKYVAYLGHDDLWLPNHLEELVFHMEKLSLEAATTRCYIFGPPETNAEYISYPNALRKPGLTVPPSALAHRLDVINRSGVWTDYKSLPQHVAPDAEFIQRLTSVSARTKSLRRLTVIKPPSAWRVDSYTLDDASELEKWSRKLDNPSLTVLSILARMAVRALRAQPVSLPHEKTPQAPGEHIVDVWRRIRGLSPR